MVQYSLPRYDMLRYLPIGVTSVLDVGCGTGSFGLSLRRIRPDLELWAVEKELASVDEAKRSAAYDNVVVGAFPGVTSELPSRHFDCVFFNDVLEHMVAPEAALEAVRPLLTGEGIVVASIPNVRCIDVLKPLVFHGDWKYEDYGLLDKTHVRFFTRKSMLRLFYDHDYHVDSIEGIHRRWDWKARLLTILLGRRIDDFLFQQYVVVARRA